MAIVSSIGLWYIKDQFDRSREKKEAEKEIENIFFYASRESEEALKNIENYVSGVRKSLEDKEDDIDIFIPQKLTRVNLNEDRLFSLKKQLDFNTSQQVDIAMSAARVMNGYLEGFERTPQFIFDATIQLISSGINTKEKAIRSYNTDIRRQLDSIESLTKDEIIIVQRHLLRPVAALASKKQLKTIPRELMDEMLDDHADLILSAVKIDLN